MAAEIKKPAAKKPAAKKTAAAKTTVKKPEIKKTVAAPKSASKPVEAVKPVTVKKPAAAKKTVVKKQRNLRKTRVGIVTSNKMDKTIVVAVVSKVPHPLYGKVVVSTKKFKAHDEKNECSIGDTVEIAETRKLSKDKYFRLVRIIEKVK